MFFYPVRDWVFLLVKMSFIVLFEKQVDIFAVGFPLAHWVAHHPWPILIDEWAIVSLKASFPFDLGWQGVNEGSRD